MGGARLIHASWVLALALGVSLAHAQECVKGDRDTTALERQTMTTNLEKALAALPAAPEGWRIGGYEEISVLQRLCMDAEERPWEQTISRTYNRVDDAAAREQAQADARVALRASMEARQPRMDALIAKSQELAAQLGQASQQGNQARVEAIQKEMEALAKESEAVMNEGPSPEQLAAIGGGFYQDTEMRIAVSVNGNFADTGDLQSAAAPAGASAAFRGEETNDSVPTAEAVVLFGSWQPRAAGGGMQLTRRGSVSSAAAHGVIVTVRADPARIDSLLAAIDLGAIAALVR